MEGERALVTDVGEIKMVIDSRTNSVVSSAAIDSDPTNFRSGKTNIRQL